MRQPELRETDGDLPLPRMCPGPELRPGGYPMTVAHTHPVVDGIPHSVYIDSDDTWHTHRVSETEPGRTGPAIAIHRIQDQADAR